MFRLILSFLTFDIRKAIAKRYLTRGWGSHPAMVHFCYTALNELHSNQLVMLCFSVIALTQEPRSNPAAEIKRLTDILSAANSGRLRYHTRLERKPDIS